MTFGSSFGRTFSPTFQPKSQAAAVAGGGWWDLNGTITSCVAAYQAKGAASYAASKVNLVNSGTYGITDGTAYPSWDSSTGWSFNGSTQFLKTGYIPSVGANLSVFVRAYQNNVDTYTAQTVIGMHATSYPYNGVYIRFRSKGNTIDNRGANDGISTTTVDKLLYDHVVGVAGREVFVDGLSESTFADSTQGFPSYDLYIGALHYSSTIQFFSGYVYATAIYEGVLTSTQITALTTAMNAL